MRITKKEIVSSGSMKETVLKIKHSSELYFNLECVYN
jgi:hypothetical protein